MTPGSDPIQQKAELLVAAQRAGCLPSEVLLEGELAPSTPRLVVTDNYLGVRIPLAELSGLDLPISGAQCQQLQSIADSSGLMLMLQNEKSPPHLILFIDTLSSQPQVLVDGLNAFFPLSKHGIGAPPAPAIEDLRREAVTHPRVEPLETLLKTTHSFVGAHYLIGGEPLAYESAELGKTGLHFASAVTLGSEAQFKAQRFVADLGGDLTVEKPDSSPTTAQATAMHISFSFQDSDRSTKILLLLSVLEHQRELLMPIATASPGVSSRPAEPAHAYYPPNRSESFSEYLRIRHPQVFALCVEPGRNPVEIRRSPVETGKSPMIWEVGIELGVHFFSTVQQEDHRIAQLTALAEGASVRVKVGSHEIGSNIRLTMAIGEDRGSSIARFTKILDSARKLLT